MTGRISRCRICGEFLHSKRELREHIDKNHRITDSKMTTAARITKLAASGSLMQVYSKLRLERDG